MSYCRWSCDNFKCDLYCYESESGFVTHVASVKIVGTVPHCSLKMLIDGTAEEYIAAHKIQSEFIESAEKSPIGLPFDGQTFRDPDILSFRDRLISLREAGYHFPSYVIEQIDEELAENAK
jgi:hypothetical protein